MEQKRPVSRKRFDSGQSASVSRRGQGLGTGPVGSGTQRTSGGRSNASGGGTTRGRAVGAGGGLTGIIVIIALVMQFLGGNSGGGLGSLSSLSGSYSGTNASMASVNTSVAAGSRAKRTIIKGSGQDIHTIMVYMCGTDLESRSGMASKDLAEMAAATISDKVQLIVYAGGCNGWKSNISSKTNQIYQIKNGTMRCLVENDGNKSMVDPDTLSSFIKWCQAKYPANRNSLIFWDHGGGSISGFGYDEKNGKGKSMTLTKIKKALKNGGVQFDFIGFDACLMATAETAIMLNDYADYLIASEETEPGIGWYYTNWLTKLSQDTSMATTTIGKNIIDDYVSTCNRSCAGQKATLSLIDLAEFSNTVPEKLGAFSTSVSNKIANKEYQQISDARNTTREFAQSSKIDQVDLVDLSDNIGTDAGKQLSAAVKSAVKYNQTSSNMTNSYGVSIYFPYKRTSYVDNACQTYAEIGMDGAYGKCIKTFAALETSGQISNGGTASPFGSLFGTGTSSSGNGSIDVSSILSMMSAFSSMSGREISIDGLNQKNIDFLHDSGLTDEEIADYIADNHMSASDLQFQKEDGKYVLSLSEKQWGLIHSVDQNLFIYDGEGYLDMGLDNVYDFDDDGNLVASTDASWLAINGQPVAYYHTDTTQQGDDYCITGYVPAVLNGQKVRLMLVFDNENEKGYIAGAETQYQEETDTVAKNMIALNVGDTLDFVCDYYNADGSYQDSYYIGKQIKVTENMDISNVSIENSDYQITYKITDIYNNEFWCNIN